MAYLRPRPAGMFIQLRTDRHHPGAAAVRHRPDRQVVPQRDHPGQFVFRTREFEQMEMEFLRPPADAQRWYEYWCNERYQWYLDHGMPADRLRARAHDATSCRTTRRAPPTWSSCSPGFGRARGIANRRLRPDPARRTPARSLVVIRPGRNERWVPCVIEPPPGRRTAMAFLMAAYDGRRCAAKGCCGSTLRDIAPPRPRCCRCRRSRTSPDRPASWPRACAVRSCATTTRPSRSGAATAARTSSAPVLHHLRLRHPRGPRVTVRDADSMDQERVALAEVEAFLAEARLSRAGRAVGRRL